MIGCAFGGSFCAGELILENICVNAPGPELDPELGVELGGAGAAGTGGVYACITGCVSASALLNVENVSVNEPCLAGAAGGGGAAGVVYAEITGCVFIGSSCRGFAEPRLENDSVNEPGCAGGAA